MIALFDLDGTLLDSRPAIVNAYQLAIAELEGHRLEPDDEHLQELMRRRPKEYFAQHYSSRQRALTEAYQHHYSSDLAKPFEGVPELLEHLSDHCDIGIVSNKGKVRILSDLDRCGLSKDRFSVIIGAEDSPERKPHPAPLLKAIENLSLKPSDAIYVGDGPHDVRAAKAAAMRSVAVAWGYYPEEQLIAASPDVICKSVQDLSKAILQKFRG